MPAGNLDSLSSLSYSFGYSAMVVVCVHVCVRAWCIRTTMIYSQTSEQSFVVHKTNLIVISVCVCVRMGKSMFWRSLELLILNVTADSVYISTETFCHFMFFVTQHCHCIILHFYEVKVFFSMIGLFQQLSSQKTRLNLVF